MNNGVILNNELDLNGKIYVVRGLQVMLDIDLAEIYGYQTKHFNAQIKNNIERFDQDFRFQLTKQEYESILRSKFSTSSWGGTRYLPHAFTEQGIYMLMTVLKGDLAITQSKALVRTFKKMKDMILQRRNLLNGSELARLSIQTVENTKDIQRIKSDMITKDDLSRIMRNFSDSAVCRDYLFFNGETVEADIAYASIYSAAKKSIHIVDNYIGLKTLVLLKSVKRNIPIIIFSDNINKGLHKTELEDFLKEYPELNISFKKTNKIYHDRYIFIDSGTNTEKIFHCGGSSKDAGKRVTSISIVTDTALYSSIIERLSPNPNLFQE